MELEVKKLCWSLGRCIKNLKVDGDQANRRYFLVGMFAVFLVGSLWLVTLESRDPYLMSLPWSGFFPYGTATVAENSMTNSTEEPVIKATYIKGKKAVKQFRNHLACFSESGKWVYDSTPRHMPWNSIGDTYASGCDSRHHWTGPGHVFGDQAEAIAMEGDPKDWLIREELKWVWRTNSSCPFWPVDRDEFCKRIGPKRNVMVVGDSINHEIAWSFMNHLVLNGKGYGHMRSGDRSNDGVYEMCGDIFGAGNGFKVAFVRNDRLSPVANISVDTWRNFYEWPWLDLLKEYDVKLLLLNRGAHYEDDKTYVRALRFIFTILSQHFPHMQVIYRNTPPGHANCSLHHEPLSERQHSDLPDGYHWEDFYRQNKIAAKIVKKFQYIYMDVDTMLSLRPEGHITDTDCLHYCLPGPLDLAVQYLYNILLLL
ncbi:hypothetical protein Mapa_002282 [Marchantia paleacea]|nr:hypothetical protein Mapa_002282 [Marchantia paleacea]